MSDKSECVRVMVRCRPMNEDEKNRKSKECVNSDIENNVISIFKPNEKDSNKVKIIIEDFWL